MTGTSLVKSDQPLDNRLSWDDVILNQDIKQKLMNFCDSILSDPRARGFCGLEPVKGILLYGPPGTGKSLVMNIIGSRMPFPCFLIDVPKIGSCYVNQSAKNLGQAFEIAKNVAADPKYGAAMLGFDEIDGLLMKRDNMHTHSEDRKVVTTFTQGMNGVEDNPGVSVAASTNVKLENIDPAVIRAGRFDMLFYIGMPDEQARADIFKLHLEKRSKKAKKVGNYSFMSSIDYNMLSKELDGRSGADINLIVNLLCLEKEIKYLKTERWTPVKNRELLEIIKTYKSNLYREEKKQLGFK